MVTSKENWSDFKKQEVPFARCLNLENALRFCDSSSQSHLETVTLISRSRLVESAGPTFTPLQVAGESLICPFAWATR